MEKETKLEVNSPTTPPVEPPVEPVVEPVVEPAAAPVFTTPNKPTEVKRQLFLKIHPVKKLK